MKRRIKRKEPKESILKILKTANVNKRLKLLDNLNGTNTRDNIKILLKVLEDSSWIMREKAAHRLAAYGGRVVPRVKKLCELGYWFIRASACLTLGEIGDLRALDSMVNLLLNDHNPTVIKEASQALVKMGRRMPEEFTKRLKELDLDNPQLLKILAILETTDTEIYSKIKQAMAMDSTDSPS